MKIVKNVCFGGYSLSDLALNRLAEVTGKSFNQCREDYDWSGDDDSRAAPELVQVVEELGDKANGSFAKLVVVEVPEDVNWYISDYDGMETIEEVHRSW